MRDVLFRYQIIRLHIAVDHMVFAPHRLCLHCRFVVLTASSIYEPSQLPVTNNAEALNVELRRPEEDRLNFRMRFDRHCYLTSVSNGTGTII